MKNLTEANPYKLRPQGFAPMQATGTLPNGDYYYCRSRGKTSIEIAKSVKDWKEGNLLFKYVVEIDPREPYMSFPDEMIDWATPIIAQYLGDRMIHKDTPVKLYGTKRPVSTAIYPNEVEKSFRPAHNNEIVIRITRNDNGELYDRLMLAMTERDNMALIRLALLLGGKAPTIVTSIDWNSQPGSGFATTEINITG